MAQWKMIDEIKQEIGAFLKGFYQIIPFENLLFKDEKELGRLLSGES